MGFLDRILGHGGNYDDDVEDEDEDDEDDEEEGDEEDDENPYGDDDENEDGYSGDLDPNDPNNPDNPFNNEEEQEGKEDGEDSGDSEGEDGKDKKKKKKKDKEGKNKKDAEGKGKIKVEKPNATVPKSVIRKNALRYECLPNPEGTCPFCHQFTIVKSFRMGDKLLVTLPILIVSKNKVNTFYCMNPRCKKNWKSGWCFRAAGERFIGSKLPTKRIFNQN